MGASELNSVSTKQQRIAELAEQSASRVFTSLAYHIDLEWLREAYRRTRKNRSSGVDGVTAAEYESNLEGNLEDLLERFKSGRYQAPPVRRAYIPKGKDGLRPIGIPTLEDKVLQRAVCMLLEPIYEHDFLDVSYGFRPRRSPHQAIHAVWEATMHTRGGWILDVDISKFFDTIDHAHIQAMLRQRVNDGVITRMIGKWLNAGVMEDGQLEYPEHGSPQGGVISPLLSNIYLHHVLDTWVETMVKPCMQGEVFLVRFADDYIIGFTVEQDARRVLEVLPKRFGKFGLTIHPEKTKLVRFQCPTGSSGKATHGSETFDFLGFTHFWGKSRKGAWIVKRKTARKKTQAKLTLAAVWFRQNMHLPLRVQHGMLCAKLRGHYQYYGINGNFRSLSQFRHAVLGLWFKWLNRRSRSGKRTWQSFRELLEVLPVLKPYIRHSNV